MAMVSFGGIDVSKDRLDVMVLPEEQCSSVPNDAAGWAKLVEQLRGFSISAIGIEASGGYERGAVRALLAAGMSVRQVNPFKLRQFARASGVLAKNDPPRHVCVMCSLQPCRRWPKGWRSAEAHHPQQPPRLRLPPTSEWRHALGMPSRSSGDPCVTPEFRILQRWCYASGNVKALALPLE
jgi:Transposase